MAEAEPEMQAPQHRLVLTAHRSLPPQGFVALMAAIGAVGFITGVVFLSIGAWPVFAFFGLDVAIVYLAFRLNYRSGRVHEIIDISPVAMTLTRVTPAGRHSVHTFNPYWTRVALAEDVDGRTTMSLASHGRSFPFGRFLNDEERRELVPVMRDLLAEVRTARPTG